MRYGTALLLHVVLPMAHRPDVLVGERKRKACRAYIQHANQACTGCGVCAGALAPPLKMILMRLTGSWVPLFGLAAALQLGAAVHTLTFL